ncbi:hypothetical protein L484_017901 [Morus notabilis]|uniref:Uncharacterized protein n=1 Tax=Morus notabilis TaxID=981085 RepID=W9RJP9_9ROSA|nr:hypothetical protein L484_017901 [Morus notabilis]
MGQIKVFFCTVDYFDIPSYRMVSASTGILSQLEGGLPTTLCLWCVSHIEGGFSTALRLSCVI